MSTPMPPFTSAFGAQNIAQENILQSADHARIGVNGRNLLRASLLRDNVSVVAINHTCSSVEDVVHLLMHDSTHGALDKLMGHKTKIDILPNGSIAIDGQHIALVSERNLEKLDWAKHGVNYVAECTGKFRSTALASKHVTIGGAKKVLISAPSPDAPNIVYKVNSDNYLRLCKETIVYSCASCTTNCLAPIAKLLQHSFGIQHAFMTTVHASTQSQHVLDGYSTKDRRSGRSIMGNIIPTTTGAAKAIKTVLPELAGKVSGISVRVPTANVSMVDFTVETIQSTSLEEIMTNFRTSAQQELSGVLQVEDEELVSSDFLGNSCSAIIDSKASVELKPNFFKIIAWYDNEWAYCCRLLDMLVFMNSQDLVSG
ncbi:hypothetical protein BHYA_0328g00060 [Botrytis hyacinthi]|uniref:Glyceraldehyde 3-phosphate dehydrogenase NAD(P) binding domain-containing protein n=1 Tax=Botrytis hyacinthi TaxID=278943 RepID=A0A4Z1GEJ4_9HELO|nr:hypothetical protein BHYA_0328g00060 [Botrytis hyacinthi]